VPPRSPLKLGLYIIIELANQELCHDQMISCYHIIQRHPGVCIANLRRLGWRVIRVPGWHAYLEPVALAAELLQMATDQAPLR
jgi:hypothetical protein